MMEKSKSGIGLLRRIARDNYQAAPFLGATFNIRF